MSEKFTKGPWKVVDNGHFLQISFPWENNPNVIDRYCRSVADIHNNDIANANLIAAAPDMYEALEEVWRILDSTMPLSRDNRADRIKRILCKARGEEE